MLPVLHQGMLTLVTQFGGRQHTRRHQRRTGGPPIMPTEVGTRSSDKFGIQGARTGRQNESKVVMVKGRDYCRERQTEGFLGFSRHVVRLISLIRSTVFFILTIIIGLELLQWPDIMLTPLQEPWHHCFHISE